MSNASTFLHHIERIANVAGARFDSDARAEILDVIESIESEIADLRGDVRELTARASTRCETSNGIKKMDIREIVESTLVAPMREQAAQALIDSKQNEIQRLNSLLDSYRTRNAEHERFIGQLHQLLKTDDLDGIRDLVEAEHDAIHGPNG